MCEFIGVEINRCQRLDCPITKLVMDAETKLDRVLADWARDNENRNAIITKLQQTIEEVEAWVLADIEKGEMSVEEYAEHYAELAEIIGLELDRVIEVVVKIEQTVSVKVPLGTTLYESDFWVTGSEFVDSNYTIESVEDGSVEDIEVNE